MKEEFVLKGEKAKTPHEKAMMMLDELQELLAVLKARQDRQRAKLGG